MSQVVSTILTVQVELDFGRLTGGAGLGVGLDMLYLGGQWCFLFEVAWI